MSEFLDHVLATATSIHKARQTQVNQFANVSRITLILYDIIINIDREKRLVWEANFRASTVLYYIVRYPVIAFQIFTVLLSPTLPHCDALYKFTFTLSITLTRIALCASFVLRVYAVLPKGIFCFLSTAVLTAVGTLSVALDIVQVTEVSCTQSSSPIWLVLTFITLICFDVISTALMSWGVFMTIREQDHGGIRVINLHNLQKWRIPAIVMRSGLLYYLVISGLQVGAVILYWLPQGIYSLVLNNYLTPLSTILVSHFLLDLREVMAQHQDATSIDQEMQFAIPTTTDVTTTHTRTGTKPGQHFSLYKDFEFEMAAFSQTRDDWDSDLHLNSIPRPLENMIEEEGKGRVAS